MQPDHLNSLTMRIRPSESLHELRLVSSLEWARYPVVSNPFAWTPRHEWRGFTMRQARLRFESKPEGIGEGETRRLSWGRHRRRTTRLADEDRDRTVMK
jgi:hypothetical protein